MRPADESAAVWARDEIGSVTLIHISRMAHAGDLNTQGLHFESYKARSLYCGIVAVKPFFRARPRSRRTVRAARHEDHRSAAPELIRQ